MVSKEQYLRCTCTTPNVNSRKHACTDTLMHTHTCKSIFCPFVELKEEGMKRKDKKKVFIPLTAEYQGIDDANCY